MLSAILGVWLFISAFVWPHTYAQMRNTWILGVLCFLIAMTARAYPGIRRLNTLLAIWLFISIWALPGVSAGTVVNNILVSVAVFILSLIPTTPTERLRPRPA